MCILIRGEKNIRRMGRLLFLLMGLVWFQCGVKVADTSGSETGNAKVIGKIVNVDGSRARNTEVRLYPANYDPIEDTKRAKIDCDTTDCNGQFELVVPDSAVYNLHAVHIYRRTCLIIPKVNVTGDTSGVTDTLKLAGRVQVILSDTMDTAKAYLYIPGSSIFSYLITYQSTKSKDRTVFLDSVPGGKELSINYAIENQYNPITITDSFIAIPDSTVVIDVSYKWRKFTLENSSLPCNHVNDITIEESGKMWFATRCVGVASFDGANWRVYNTGNSKLPNNNINTIVIDKDGTKWCSTMGNGVAAFDGNSWTVYDSSNSPLYDNTISSIMVDKHGNKWFCTCDYSLIKFDGIQWEIFKIDTLVGGCDCIGKASIDKDGDIWILSEYQGVARYDGAVWIRYDGSNSVLRPGEVNSLVIDNNDNKWFATDKCGLVRYNNNGWTSLTSTNSDLPSNNVLSMVEDLNENLWIGVKCGTLSRLSKKGILTVYDKCCKLYCNYNIIPTIVDKKNNIWCRRLSDNGGGVVVFGPDVPDLQKE